MSRAIRLGWPIVPGHPPAPNGVPTQAISSPIDGAYLTDPRPAFPGRYLTPPVGYAQ